MLTMVCLLPESFEKHQALDTAQKNLYAEPGRYSAASCPGEEHDIRLPRRRNEVSSSAAYSSARCAFCGRDMRYNFSKCSACSAACFRCHRKGHFARACNEPAERLDATSTSAAVFYPSLCTVKQAPECLPTAVIDSYVCEKHMSTLIHW